MMENFSLESRTFQKLRSKGNHWTWKKNLFWSLKYNTTSTPMWVLWYRHSIDLHMQVLKLRQSVLVILWTSNTRKTEDAHSWVVLLAWFDSPDFLRKFLSVFHSVGAAGKPGQSTPLLFDVVPRACTSFVSHGLVGAQGKMKLADD